MKNLTYPELFDYIAFHIINPFYELRLKRLHDLKLKQVLKRKNPYLFKAKNITTAQDFITEILNAHLSSQEETIFGNYLEELAIHICAKEFGGFKSSSEGIDLDFQRDGKRYIVTIKSGPNWANSGQTSKMKDNFQKAKQRLRANSSITNIIAVNGCCYGKTRSSDRGEYVKLCGQEFWEFISGDKDLYMKIIEPLGKEAKQKDELFKDEYSKKINLLTMELLDNFCFTNGEIDWNSLLKFVSSKHGY